MKAGDNGSSLGLVIKSFNSIKIEDYQRTYSWEGEQLEAFFEDLISATSPEVENHFFGTLIFQESQTDPRKATVVDGQQRLTTVFLTIAAIRDAAAVLPEKVIPAKAYGRVPERPEEEAIKFLIPETDTGNTYRFEPNRFIKPIVDASVFAPHDKQEKLKLTDKKITLPLRHAVRKIREKIREELERKQSDLEKLVFLNDLLNTLTKKFLVLKIQTNNLSESLDIFLTLNDRGMPLGPSDIVKGKIMSALGSSLESEQKQLDLQEKINFEWEALSEGVEDPDVFMRHFLISSGKQKVQKKKVVKFVEERLKPRDNSRTEFQAADEFWQKLKASGGIYSALVKVALTDPEAKYHLSLLEGLQKSHRIFLLAVLERDDLATSSNFRELVRMVFVLSFRWALADKSRQGLEDTFQEMALQTRGIVDDSDEPNEKRRLAETKILEKLAEQIEKIDVDFEKVLSRDIDGSFIAKAVLHYAQKLTAGSSVLTNLKEVHLEHIAPQTSTEAWKRMLFGNNVEKQKDYGDLITAIGNLTLLDPGLNTKLLNKPFKDKRDEYKKSAMYLTTNLSDFEVWDESLIKARTIWLANFFARVCSLEGPPKSIPSFTTWHTLQGS